MSGWHSGKHNEAEKYESGKATGRAIEYEHIDILPAKELP